MTRRFLGLACLLLVGCGAGGGPKNTLSAYAKALDGREFSSAYRLMSEDYRSKHSKEEFVALLKENKREVRETSERLAQAPSKVFVTAEYRYGAGDVLRLVQEGGRWRIASDPMVFYAQDTPRNALRSFLRAYRLNRWKVMMRFVPERFAARMGPEKLKEQFAGEGSEELASRIEMLESSLDGAMVEKGNQARMRYGERYEVKLVRENGRWKIRDLD